MITVTPEEFDYCWFWWAQDSHPSVRFVVYVYGYADYLHEGYERYLASTWDISGTQSFADYMGEVYLRWIEGKLPGQVV